MTRILALLLAISATQATAQLQRCADHEQVVTRLAERYGETRQAIGLGSDNSVMELFASEESGSWTITVTKPGGPTCLVAAGEAYQYLAEALMKGDPT